MYYVYFLRSIKFPEKTYIGYTTDVQERIETHNAGKSFHTRDYKPWKLVAYVAFDEKLKAIKFEKYVKVGSGHAFANKRFW